jgi:hypothetical protein
MVPYLTVPGEPEALIVVAVPPQASPLAISTSTKGLVEMWRQVPAELPISLILTSSLRWRVAAIQDRNRESILAVTLSRCEFC